MRSVLAVADAPRPHWVGDGFHVQSLLSPSSAGADLSPFLMLDYAAPRAFAPAAAPRGVGEHPHRGFETVTIVYQGELEHRDSTGSGGKIGPGDVQWMTAASGILHEEFHSSDFTRKGGTLEMVQLWINLPAKDKAAAAGYQTLLDAAIPSVSLADGAGRVRVIAGDFQGHKGPAQTFTPVNVWDVRLAAGKAAALSLPEGHTAALAVFKGSVRINGMQEVHTAQLVTFASSGGEIAVQSGRDATLLVLSGAPIGEPVIAHGPFVMNTLGEIKQAMRDYESGRFGALT